MKISDYKISLDILKSQSQYSLPMKKGDTARVIYITLRQGGVPFEIGADCFAVLSGKKPDGTIFENNCVISDNTIIYAITPQTTAAGGLIECEVKLYGNNNALISSPRFTIIVDERAVGEDEIISSNEYSALTNLYSETNFLKNDIQEKLESGYFKGEKGDKGDKGDTGEKGEQGIQGIRGEKGDTPEIDQTYSATSENAQSGLAVAEAVATANSYTDGKIMRLINYISIPSDETADMILIDKNGADESFSLKHIKFMIDLRIPSSQTVRCTVRINGVSVIMIPQFSSLLTVKIIGEIKIFQAGINVNYSYLTSNPNIPINSGVLNSKNVFATLPPTIKNPITKIDVRVVDETNNIIQLKANSSIELWGC